MSIQIKPFQLLIKPVSADCNLHCHYCFYLRVAELYPSKRHLMTEEILVKMIREFLSYRFPESIFAWQGGEPTLAGLDFFYNVIEKQQQYGGTGQIIGNALQTNGILIDEEWCKLFVKYNFLIGLSLDGPQDIHDAVRINRGGQGTWNRVMETVECMRRWNVEFNILCVVHKHNVNRGEEILRWFIKQGFRFIQFIPCVEPNSPFNVTPKDYGTFLCEIFDYWSREGFGKISIRDFDALLSMRLGVNNSLCIFGDKCDQYIVIEHNGDVYPCDFFVYPEYKLGNVMETPLHLFFETEKFRQFSYQKTKVPKCRGCPWRKTCYGGCQKDRLVAGSTSEPSALCEAYKIFFAHANSKLNSLAKRIKIKT